jgi:hypothetical protein
MNAKKITPLKKTSESFLKNLFHGLFAVVTLGFYMPYAYKNQNIANVNIMSRLALGGNVEDVKFSANFMYGALIAFWLSLGLAIFGDVVINLLVLSMPANVFVMLLGVCVVSGLMLILYGFKIISNIKDRLLKISESYGRIDVIRLYVTDVGLFSSNREKLNQRAFNKLVDDHNNRINGYESQANQQQCEDEQDERAENSSPNDYGEANPFEILGVTETASENEVKNAFWELSKKWHPDTYQTDDQRVKELSTEKFIKIQQAYEQIKQRKGWQ